MQLTNSFKNMALLAMLACAAQAPGAAAFSPNGLSRTRAFVGKLDLACCCRELESNMFLPHCRTVTQSEILHGFGELTEDRKSEPIASSL
jgi:hypothetical protein